MKYNVDVNQFCGDLPRHEPGRPNAGQIDRAAVSVLYGFTIRQLTKAYLNWQDVFRYKDSTLTYQDYLDKMIEAEITPDDIGNGRKQYNLSRYGDEGPYTKQNCRFILRVDNEREQKRTRLIRTYICRYCSGSFESSSKNRKFCSRQCMGYYNMPAKAKTAPPPFR